MKNIIKSQKPNKFVEVIFPMLHKVVPIAKYTISFTKNDVVIENNNIITKI